MQAGMYGTREYPYRQSHSTSCRAAMFMQHVVVIHKTSGRTKAKQTRIHPACNKWVIS
jgi:hypothetical protein